MSTWIPPRPDLGVGSSAGSMPADAQRPTWSPGAAIGMYLAATFASLFLASSVSIVLRGSVGEVAANIAAALGTLAIVVAWLRFRHPGWRGAIGLGDDVTPRRTKDLAWGFVAGLILYPLIAFGAAIILSLILSALSGAEVSAPQQVPTALPAAGDALVILYAGLIAPFAEEFFFRGVLFTPMLARWGFWPAALASGLLFGAIHYVPAAWQDSVLLMAAMVPTGVALAWFRRRRGSLYASIGAHLAFNVVGLVFIYVVGS